MAGRDKFNFLSILSAPSAAFAVPEPSEEVDAAGHGIYKGGTGGGRNPAAAILCEAPSSEHYRS
jgi:hypothetical protein